MEDFFALVSEFREAQKAVDATRPGSAIHASASRSVANLGPRRFVVSVACLLGCGQQVEHDTTVAEYADLRYAPRGVCERH